MKRHIHRNLGHGHHILRKQVVENLALASRNGHVHTEMNEVLSVDA